MADTLTLSDELRSRDEPGAPSAPPAVPGAVSLADIAARVAGRQYGPEGPYARAAEATRAKTTAQAPIIAQAQRDLAAPMPEAPAPPPMTPPPSRGLHAFLAPVNGEHPITSITKLVTALGPFAAGLGIKGSAHGAARASLAALNGALAGWAAGDKERADRAFADWQAQSETALTTWKTQDAAYRRALEKRGLSLQERLAEVKLATLSFDNDIAAATLEAQGLEGFLGYLTATEASALKHQEHRDRLIEQKQRADELAAYRREQLEVRREALADKRSEREQMRSELDAAYTPEIVRSLGQQWAMDPKGTIQGLGYGKAAQLVRPKIVAAGLAWLREQGIDPETLPQVRAEIGAARSALTKLRGVNAVQMASIRRFDGHADKLLELSGKVDRTGSPVFNRYLLKLQGKYAGDADVAAFETQAFELAMEFSRVVVGTAQGDAMTRDEARKTISAALNPEQLKAVVETLRGNAHRNIEANRVSEAELTKVVESVGGQKKPAATIRVKRKSDGQTGTLLESDFDPAKYERIGDGR